MKKICFLAFNISLFASLMPILAQQKISADFTKPLLKEDFNEENKNWNYQTTYENFFVVDKGDFFLNRINKTNPYAILTNWQNDLTKFQIRSALKLAPEQGKEQTIGIIFLVQSDGKGAVVLEINREKEYRIKQLVGQYYRYLSGEKESQGWMKASFINNKEDYNEFDIRVFEGQMDFYINKKFVNSFNVEDYKAGGMGFIIGPNTKAKIDYFNVYSLDDESDSLQNFNGEFTKRIKGEELIAKLEGEKTALSRQVEEGKQKFQNFKQERETELVRMKALLDVYIKKNDSLEVRARSLTYLEDELLQGISQDLLLTLTTELRDQIKRNQKLEEELGFYKDSLFITHKRYQDLKSRLLAQMIDKRTLELKAKEAENSKLTKQEILKINEARAAFVKDSLEKVKKAKPETKSAKEKDERGVVKTKLDKEKKEIAKDKKETIKEKEVSTSSESSFSSDGIKPNPRSKRSDEDLDKNSEVGIQFDTLPPPAPIRSKVKKAEKVIKNQD